MFVYIFYKFCKEMVKRLYEKWIVEIYVEVGLFDEIF